ncbi:MAG: ABC transporter substrate-binding protein [Steroidobacteraceae bacterium]
MLALICLVARVQWAPAAGLDKVTVRLDWLASAYHAPLFVARARGYYAEQGLDVELQNGQGSLSTLQVVGSGNDTIGLANISAIATAAGRGVPVVAIGGLIQRAPEAVLSLASANIRKPKDLEGKRWGAVAGDEAQRLFEAYAAVNQIDLRKIRKITLNHGAALTSLLNGDVDFICAWALEDGLKLARVKPIAPPLLFADSGINTLGTAFFVTRATLQAKPDVLRRFMVATQKGAAAMSADPAAAVQAVYAARPENDRAMLEQEIAGLGPYLRTQRSAGRPFGWLASEDVESMLAVMRQHYGLSANVLAAQIFTNRFVE